MDKKENMKDVVQRDWENREFIENIQQSILQIVTFLNQFDISTRYRLAQVQSKLTRLERHLDYLEASISQSDPRVREAEKPKVVAAPTPVAPATPESMSASSEGVPPPAPLPGSAAVGGPPPSPPQPGAGPPPHNPQQSRQSSTSSKAPPPNPMLANGSSPGPPPGVPGASPPPPPGAGGRPPPSRAAAEQAMAQHGRPNGGPVAPIPVPGRQPPMPNMGHDPTRSSPPAPRNGGPPPQPHYMNGGPGAGPVPVPGQQPPQPPGGMAGRPPPQDLAAPPMPPSHNGSEFEFESRTPSPGVGENDSHDSAPVTPRNGAGGKKKKKKDKKHRHRRMKLGEKKDISLKVLKEGDGKTFPHAQSIVTVDYTGYLQDGNKFDTSVDYTIALGTRTVVEGLEIVLQEMSLGSRASFKIPAYLAYGASGAPGVIPPDCDLKFDLELKDVQV